MKYSKKYILTVHIFNYFFKYLLIPKTIKQKFLFKNTKPKDLYDLYMDSKKHSLATGAPATISPKEGGKYSAHGNYIKGKNLQLIKNKLIVQTWRGAGWDKADEDSTFIIYLEQKGNDMFQIANMITSLKDGMSIIGSTGKNILQEILFPNQ